MMQYRFADPAAFQLLWLLPLVVVASWILLKRQHARLSKALGPKTSKVLTASLSVAKRRWKLVLELIALGFLVVALARPQSGESQQKVRSEGIEIMFLFDVSRSMEAEDVKPSRMELAKKEVIRFIESGGGDRMGLVAFAGSAITLSPMTNDRNALKMYIESLTTDAVQTQGTEFRRALLEARDAFKKGGLEEDEQTVVTRAIVIVSDGEDNEQGALTAAEELQEEGIYVFSLAVGTEQGGQIPIYDRFRNKRGYRKDKDNRVVVTKSQTKLLKDLATSGKGGFYYLTLGGDAIGSLRQDLSKLEQSEFATASITNYNELYQTWLFIGLIFALAELVVSERRKKGRIWKGRFEVLES